MRSFRGTGFDSEHGGDLALRHNASPALSRRRKLGRFFLASGNAGAQFEPVFFFVLLEVL
jgi:hypothetical protein